MTDVSILPLAPAEFFPVTSHSAHLPLIEDDELVSLLEGAAESELDGLVQCLIGKGGITCQLKRLKVFKENQPHHRFYARDIAAEIQKYGANTLVSHAFRSGKGVYYAEIARDVASKLRLPLSKDVRETEASIQAKLLDEFWRGLSVEQQRALLESLNMRDCSSIAKAAAPACCLRR
jgi:hypothetical protein